MSGLGCYPVVKFSGLGRGFIAISGHNHWPRMMSAMQPKADIDTRAIFRPSFARGSELWIKIGDAGLCS